LKSSKKSSQPAILIRNEGKGREEKITSGKKGNLIQEETDYAEKGAGPSRNSTPLGGGVGGGGGGGGVDRQVDQSFHLVEVRFYLRIIEKNQQQIEGSTKRWRSSQREGRNTSGGRGGKGSIKTLRKGSVSRRFREEEAMELVIPD